MNRESCYAWMESPIGSLLLVGGDAGLTKVLFAGAKPEPDWHEDRTRLGAAIAQLEEYFAAERRAFDLTLAPEGTPFQLRVWEELLKIPYGTTVSYGELAQRLGNPGASRAVGLANGANPIAVIIPCHRVIGSNGKLTGYGGGVERKKFLLDFERRHARASEYLPGLSTGSGCR